MSEAVDPALERFSILRPHLENGIPLTAVARDTGTPIGTLRRWLRLYRRDGLAGLARKPRSDVAQRRVLDPRYVTLIEGLALSKPPPSIANIHRKISALISAEGGKPPSYSTVRGVVMEIGSGMAMLAHHGAKAYGETYDLVHRREATGPNAIWQADHTQLDIVVLNETGAPVRPWLTVVIDDYSRAIAAFRLFTAAPSALQTALALRDAIWRKPNPGWSICGIPEVLYTDHGSDFTSRHIERVCAELKVQLVFSQKGRPQGRGRVERFFETLNQRVLSTLPGYLVSGSPAKPSLTMGALEAELRAFILGEYHDTAHSGTGAAPEERWSTGFLPRFPEGLEALDELLLQVARPRKVHRDGIRLGGLRYIDPGLAAFVGEPVLVRYDPADMSEIRVFHGDQFLCRVVCPELSADTVSLQDIVQARRTRQRQLCQDIETRRSLVDAVLGARPARQQPPPKPISAPRPRHRLRIYRSE